MQYKLIEFIIPYVILLSGLGMLKIVRVVMSKWTNILNVYVDLFGTIAGITVVGYSFLRMGRTSWMYIENYWNSINFEVGLTSALIRMCLPMLILIITGSVLLKVSDINKKKGKVNIYEIAVTSSALSIFGTVIMFLEMNITALNNVLHLV